MTIGLDSMEALVGESLIGRYSRKTKGKVELYRSELGFVRPL